MRKHPEKWVQVPPTSSVVSLSIFQYVSPSVCLIVFRLSVLRPLCCCLGPSSSRSVSLYHSVSRFVSLALFILNPDRTLARILEAFREFKVGNSVFAGVDGYGHGDIGRETLDKVYARLFGAEAALVG